VVFTGVRFHRGGYGEMFRAFRVISNNPRGIGVIQDPEDVWFVSNQRRDTLTHLTSSTHANTHTYVPPFLIKALKFLHYFFLVAIFWRTATAEKEKRGNE
jgi:hypothetical protein